MKQERFVLEGTDNDGFRHRYSFQKSENFKKIFPKFMEALEFDPKKIKSMFSVYDENDHLVILRVAEFEDCIRHYKNSKFDVDVFFGRKKIIILVRTKRRRSIVEFLEKNTRWIKKIEIKRRSAEKKKRVVPLQKIKS